MMPKLTLSIRLDAGICEKLKHMGKNKASFIEAAIEDKLKCDGDKLDNLLKIKNEKIKEIDEIDKEIKQEEEKRQSKIEKNKDKANELFREVIDLYKSSYSSKGSFIHNPEIESAFESYLEYSYRNRKESHDEIISIAKKELGIKEGDINGRE